MSDYSDERINEWINHIKINLARQKFLDMARYNIYPGLVYPSFGWSYEYKEDFLRIPQVLPSKTDKLIFNPSINPMTAELIEQIEMFWN